MDAASRQTIGLNLATRDGRPLLVRPAWPEDKPRFQEGLTRLSPASRHYRFLVGLRQLTPAHLRDLTDFDRRTQAAWVALDAADPGLRGVGVGRYVADMNDPAAAEVALTTTDDFQRVGVGQLLLAILTLSAHARGVRRFTGRIAFDNEIAANWFRRLGGSLRSDGDAFSLDLPLDRDRLLRDLLRPRKVRA